MKSGYLTAATLLLALSTGAALAQQLPAPPSADNHRAQWCAENPKECEAIKARRDARCAENPAKCEEIKAKREARKAACDADPEQCKAERSARLQAQRAKLEQRCKEQPDGKACKRLERGIGGDKPATP